MAVCGDYVCEDDSFSFGRDFYSGEKSTQDTWCNNIVGCHNGGVDEKYCTGEEEEMFQCRENDGTVISEIPLSKVCDRKCDCNSYCDDEWNCNGYTYHYWYKCNNSSEYIPSFDICDTAVNCNHGDDESNCGNDTCTVISTLTYILANYSRCTPLVECINKLDQTNCSDTTIAPLQCPINGQTSTVSQLIICTTAYMSNTSAVCDDGMDVECVTPTPGCYIHKHQLCDNNPDCKGGSDEKSALCSIVTTKSYHRKYHYSKSLKLPKDWINDGIEDYIGGIDEDIREWNTCVYSTFTIYGSGQCEDVYICPSGYLPYVEIPSLCDEMLSCEGGNGICETTALASPQLRYTPVTVENVNYLHYCLLGLQNLKIFFVGCEQVNYPTIDILATQPNYLFLPVKQIDCELCTASNTYI